MSDYDYIDPKLNRFMASVRPEVKDYDNRLLQYEGYEQGKKTFNQALAELVHYLGLSKATEFLSSPCNTPGSIRAGAKKRRGNSQYGC